MHWYQYITLSCLMICFAACLWHFLRLIRLGKVKDLSRKSGNIAQAEVYSYTTAMLPAQKESAYLHIPTFTAGILFHLGSFIGLILFVVFFFAEPEIFRTYLVLAILFLLLLIGLAVSAMCGFGLMLKRIFSKKLRDLSTIDDYLSNFLTTFFQICTGFYLIFGGVFAPYYYIAVSVFLLYIPVGKLRHVIYFFAARHQLGYFYGWRNSWPPRKSK
jgi:nitrate reductase gamma subunit